ncbi:MAG: response regulator [Gammaproteobacteria bacterium]|nr:response regulator [Gammaproteobacteria bacterium]MBT6043207.1 response regulator [Gammaproteobacteria bacterium]
MKEELRTQYVKSLESRIETINSLKTKFFEGNEIADQNIRLLAHQLHASGATFGFHAITKASAILEAAKEDDLVPRMMELKSVLEKIIKGYSVAFPDKIAASNARPVYEKKADEKLVLIIEDDPAIVAQISSCLDQQSGKITTVVAEDALHAEEELLKGDYDLVIIDLVLPDKDGREILREIKIDFQLAFPVIILSGISKDLVRVDCMSLGADRYIAKPLDQELLSKEIGKLLVGEESSSLSLMPMEEAQQSAEDEVHLPLEGMTILVTENDKHLGELICHLMTDEGAQVSYASNGRETIEALRSTQCSLLILDLNMPDMDGIEVLKKIRGEMDLKGLPVILLTALGGEADIMRGYDVGVNDYILKPISEVYLAGRVKSLLKHH